MFSSFISITSFSLFFVHCSLLPLECRYVKKMFDEHDDDGSGNLTHDEMYWTVSSLCLGLDDKDIFRLCAKADGNNVSQKREPKA